jgi:hypothetical protein
LIVRDVDVETFPDHDNQLILKFHRKYLQAEKGKPVKLGHNKRLACFLAIDNQDFPEGIQLESVEYPGYLICYQKGKWFLQSQYYVNKSKKTIFLPLGTEGKRKRFSLVNLYNQNCLTVRGANVVARPFHSKPKKNQLFAFKKY